MNSTPNHQFFDLIFMNSQLPNENNEIPCQHVHRNITDACKFVKDTPDCSQDLSIIDYTQFMYCGFEPHNIPIAIGICIVWVVLLFISLAVTATDFLCPSLFVISKTLKLSQNVAGVTLVAFGNGSVDIFAAIAGMRQGKPDLVVGALLGGGAFVTLFVIGSIFALSKSFKLQGQIFIRDCVFYLISISWIFYCFVGPKKIQLHDAIGFLLLYAFYVVIVLLSKLCCKGTEQGVIAHHGHGMPKQSVRKQSVKKEHKITFEGVKADKDPDEGMIVMKGFLFLTDQTLTENKRKAMSIKKRRNLPNVIPIIKITPDKEENANAGAPSQLNSKETNQKQEKPKQEQQAVKESASNGITNLLEKSVEKSIEKLDDKSIEKPIETSTPIESDESKDSNIIKINVTQDDSILEMNPNDTITSANQNTLMEDASVYSTVSSTMDLYGTRTSAKSNTASIFTLTINQEQLIQMRRASKEFLEKITPIDKEVWRHGNWGGKSFEIIKSPIRFFLLLTTPMADLEEREEWNKPLSVLHCITGPLFVLLASGFFTYMIGGIFPIALIVFLVAGVIAVVIVFTSRLETPPGYYTAYSSYLGFIVAVTWIFVISNEAVSAIRSIGVALNLSEIAIGMTILAWGNCLLDFISNLSIARKGFPKMAIAACLGAPLLSLLSGVGLPASAQLLLEGGSIHKNVKPDKLITIIYFAIAAFLVITILKLLLFRFHVKKFYGILLIVIYIILIIFTLFVEWNFITLPFLIDLGLSE